MPFAKRTPRLSSNTLWMAFFLISLLLVTSAGCDAGTTTDCSLDTFVVTTTEDIDDDQCTAGHCSLREAVNAANACDFFGITTIQLGEGTYGLTLRGPGDDRGDLDILKYTAIVGISPENTIIQGESSWNDRIFHVNEFATVEIENLTVANGNSGDEPGGGIYNEGILTLENVYIQNNHGLYGAGLFNSSIATLQSIRVSENQDPSAAEAYELTTDSYTYGFFTSCGGGIANIGTMTISRANIVRNRAVLGAGVCNGRGASLSYDDGLVADNSGMDSVDSWTRMGGGIYNLGDLTLSNVGVNNNFAESGGGIYSMAASGTRLSIEHIFVIGNRAGNSLADEGNGAGLYLSREFEIHNSQIMDNEAMRIGGYYKRIQRAIGGRARITARTANHQQ